MGRVIFSIIEAFIAIFALGIFAANFPFAVIKTFGLETMPAQAQAEVRDKFRETTHAGGYQERHHVLFTVALENNQQCNGEAIIDASDYTRLKVGDRFPVELWAGHCLDMRDVRWRLNSQLFIWLHFIVGALLMVHVLRRLTTKLSTWEVKDGPSYR